MLSERRHAFLVTSLEIPLDFYGSFSLSTDITHSLIKNAMKFFSKLSWIFTTIDVYLSV